MIFVIIAAILFLAATATIHLLKSKSTIELVLAAIEYLAIGLLFYNLF